MASNTEKNSESSDSPIATPVAKQPTLEVVETKSERIKATRHPRWTRQETLVLIEAKKMVENGEQLFRFKSSYGLLNNSDPKWEIVSSCCQQQGVKRGSVQCRKRWGNLLTDFRKIKKWESSVKDEEKQQHPSCQGNYYPGCHREPMFQEGHKRKRSSPDNSEDATDFSNNIIKVLRRNTNIMKAYLGAQNINQQLARDQQKEQSDNLVAALGKLTDAMTKIADKL
ncbi:hypothetical protein TanjilG_27484 [Lupinus angustifolius]|uniref:Myb-like domain-containing protein n=1 Tax=Lupinus angustifolius TaxID=3871 RepID=A0A4P1R2V0_LUPAN|nr:hypothetical protein TanjilG_27484 [Lupinus angustifolius]